MKGQAGEGSQVDSQKKNELHLSTLAILYKSTLEKTSPDCIHLPSRRYVLGGIFDIRGAPFEYQARRVDTCCWSSWILVSVQRVLWGLHGNDLKTAVAESINPLLM